MCGIAGIIDLEGNREINLGRLRRMTDRMVHRGPDGEGFFHLPGVGLGHRRLAIIDVAGSPQPMSTGDGTVTLTFNGEIYNYASLRDDLTAAGHHFHTAGDTEVLLEAYRAYGAGALNHLEGMFAFAIWDASAKAVLLGRDRLGEKPLYYAVSDGFLIFASELPAVVLGLGRTPKLNPRAVADYFALGYVPEPKSIYEGIQKLEPGHFLRATRGGEIRVEAYWQPSIHRQRMTMADALEGTRDRFAKVVAAEMVSDVPLGAFLSGGVDSSGVVAMMADTTRGPVHTCCVGFDDNRFDERAQAAQVADRFQTAHASHVLELDAAAMIPEAAYAYGEPFADSSALPTMAVSRAARQSVTVALSGDGGDELFLGYRRYPFHAAEERFKGVVPLAIRERTLAPLANLWPKLDWAPRPLRAKATLQALATDAVNGYLRAVTAVPTASARKLFTGDLVAALDGYHPSEVLAEHARAADTDDPLARAQYIDLKTWLPGRMLTKVDRASMAASLEVRPPLLHVAMVEWALSLPSSLNLGRRGGKLVLKGSLEDHLPEDLLYRRKQGFSPPLAQWLRDGLEGRVDALTGGHRLRETGLFEMATVSSWADEHRRGVRDHSGGLWALVMFEAFLEQQDRLALSATTPAATPVAAA